MSQYILATGGYDSNVRLFDAQNTHLLRTIQFPDAMVLQLAFSGHGQIAYSNEPLILAVAGSPRIMLYDASIQSSSSSPLFTFEGHTGPVTAVGFDPLPHPQFVFSASEDKTLQVWKPSRKGVLASHFAVDVEKSLRPTQCQDDSTVSDVADSTQQVGFQGRQSQNSQSADRSSDTLYKWMNDSPINAAVYYAPGSIFLTADRGGHIKLWEREHGTPKKTLTPHKSALHLQTLELSFDNTFLVTADTSCRVFIYHMPRVLADEDPAPSAEFIVADSKHYVSRTRLSTDNQTLACTLSTGQVKVYSLPDVISQGVDGSNDCKATVPSSVKPRRNFQAHSSWVWDAVFVGDASNYLFTCSFNAQVMLWDLDCDSDVKSSTEYRPHNKAVVCLAIKEQCAATAPA